MSTNKNLNISQNKKQAWDKEDKLAKLLTKYNASIKRHSSFPFIGTVHVTVPFQYDGAINPVTAFLDSLRWHYKIVNTTNHQLYEIRFDVYVNNSLCPYDDSVNRRVTELFIDFLDKNQI